MPESTKSITNSQVVAELDKFPFPPSFEATWFPMYWEPMITSGERITAGIVIVGSNGEIYANASLRRDVLKVIYKDQADSALDMISWLVDSARTYAEKNKSLDGWTPPFDGAFVGDARRAQGEDFQDIFVQAVQMTASLSSTLIEDMVDDLSILNRERDRWKEKIKSTVIERIPDFESRFDRKFTVQAGARSTIIDYVGKNLSANFGKLIPTNLSRSIRDSKAQIVDLATLRDQLISDKSPESHQLMMWRPSIEADFSLSEKQIKSINEALLELEFEADKFELRVRSYMSPLDVANEIVNAETRAT